MQTENFRFCLFWEIARGVGAKEEVSRDLWLGPGPGYARPFLVPGNAALMIYDGSDGAGHGVMLAASGVDPAIFDALQN